METRTLRIGLLCSSLAVLAACDAMFPAEPDPSPRIDIHADRFVYRHNNYRSISALDIALKTANVEPRTVELHDCRAYDQLEPVLELIRGRGALDDLDVILPEGC